MLSDKCMDTDVAVASIPKSFKTIRNHVSIRNTCMDDGSRDFKRRRRAAPITQHHYCSSTIKPANMCRICGRFVRCIFDSMPSRTISKSTTSSFRSINKMITQQRASISSLPIRERTPQSQPSKSRIHTTSVQQATVEPFSASDPSPIEMGLSSTLSSSVQSKRTF